MMNRKASTYKIIENKLPFTHLKIGDDNWEPTPDQINEIVSSFAKASEVKRSVVGTTRSVEVVQVMPGFLLVKIDFEDLKKGDKFCLYEPGGGLIKPNTPVNVCLADAIESVVECEPLVGRTFDLPEMDPA